MNLSMNRIWLLILILSLFACSKDHKAESILIAHNGEYWQYENKCGSHGINFQFNADGSYDKYNHYTDKGFVLFNNDGDLISGKRSWSIVKDSILVWDNLDYKIVSITEKKIILSYFYSKDKSCKVILIKVFDQKNSKRH